MDNIVVGADGCRPYQKDEFMNSAFLLTAVVVVFVFGFRVYGKFLENLFDINPANKTPAHEKYDGVDYVPAKHWLALFGHHFSSICGAAPIIGPAVAVAYWGWAPTLAWIVLGTLLMGAVSDFSSLIISVRHEGKSMTDISGQVISRRAKIVFGVFIWIALVLVIAVFAILAAKTFVNGPKVVLPSLGLIPIAVLCGWLMYAQKMNMLPITLIGIGLIVACQWGGRHLPIQTPEKVLGFQAEQFWILLFLIYCFVASVTPVQYLLQPRDYLASYILFGAVGAGLIGALVSGLPMQAKAVTEFNPGSWPSAGILWPMMFVTVSCGAISGFHALVSSGTTSKQLSNECHACRIGYGGMLMEGLMAGLVVVCVGAGLSVAQHAQILKHGPGAIVAFGTGYGEITKPFLGGYGQIFAISALNAFILTTLDTATRLCRYLTTELTGIKNRYAPAALVVLVSGTLAFSGQWKKIWPAFGTSNQLIAALSLLVISAWLLARGKPAKPVVIPAVIMLLTTTGAFIWQLYKALTKTPHPDYLIMAVILVLLFLSFFMLFETWKKVKKYLIIKY